MIKISITSDGIIYDYLYLLFKANKYVYFCRTFLLNTCTRNITHRLNKEEMKELLLKLPEVREDVK